MEKVGRFALHFLALTHISVDQFSRRQRQSLHDSRNEGGLQVHDAGLRSNEVRISLIDNSPP
jgi:hypothetical protein